MELTVESDIYCPIINDIGNYVDKVPSFINIKNGIRCPCGARRDKIYDSHSCFSAHLKTKVHQKWLNELNMNKTNFYNENIQLKETIKSQQQIICKLERELKNKSVTIDYLSNQLASNFNGTPSQLSINLIDFD